MLVYLVGCIVAAGIWTLLFIKNIGTEKRSIVLRDFMLLIGLIIASWISVLFFVAVFITCGGLHLWYKHIKQRMAYSYRARRSRKRLLELWS